jgi:hypothetical protein
MACYAGMTTALIGAWALASHLTNPPATFYWATRGTPTEIVLRLLIFAPIIESLLLIGILELLRLARAPTVIQVLVPALLISATHMRPWWPRIAVVGPAFCIEACSYLYCLRSSRKAAFGVVVFIHALNNVSVALSYIGAVSRHA